MWRLVAQVTLTKARLGAGFEKAHSGFPVCYKHLELVSTSSCLHPPRAWIVSPCPDPRVCAFEPRLDLVPASSSAAADFSLQAAAAVRLPDRAAFALEVDMLLSNRTGWDFVLDATSHAGHKTEHVGLRLSPRPFESKTT